MKKLAVLVGHNKYNRGAVTPEGVTEFEFNEDVAWLMLEKQHDFEIRVFYRYPEENEILRAYERINGYDPDAILELHFNSHEDTRANGTEMLFWEFSENGHELAYRVKDSVIKTFGTRERFLKPVNGDRYQDGTRKRGYRSLVSGRAPTVICEPFFGSNVERNKFIPHPEKLAKAYLSSVSEYFGEIS